MSTYKGRLLNDCSCKHIFITILEDGTLEVGEEDGHTSSYSLRTGRHSVLELEEEGVAILITSLDLFSGQA
jgi:hypothetical protein